MTEKEKREAARAARKSALAERKAARAAARERKRAIDDATSALADAPTAGARTGSDVRGLRGLAHGQSHRCESGQEWTRDDALELVPGLALGGWIVDGLTQIFDPQVPVL